MGKKSTTKRLMLPLIMSLLGIIIINLVSAFMFYFGDGPRKPVGFLIAFSPTMILLISLFAAWRWQFIGGTILIMIGAAIIIGLPVLYLILTQDSEYFVGPLLIAFIIGIPIILSGILFRKSH